MERIIPTSVVDIMTLINRQNKESFIIGGATRDLLIGKKPSDYDLCTNMSLLEIKNILPTFHIMKQNSRRSAGIIRIGNDDIEISEYKGNDLQQDIQKRDFTINAIPMDKNGNTADENNYTDDIYQKIIRLIDETGNSIIENPLLILRAIRFSLSLNFYMESKTMQLMFKHKELLNTVISERLNIEITKIISLPNFKDSLFTYYDIYKIIIPELDNIPKKEYQRLVKLLTILPSNKILILAALFTYNQNSIEDFNKFASKIKLDKRTIKLVSLLLKYKNKELSPNKKSINRAISEFNIQYVDLLLIYKRCLHLLDNKEINELDKIIKIYTKQIIEFRNQKIKNIKINREKIQELGYAESEAVLIYEKIEGKVLENRLPNDQNTINDYILRHYKRS